MTIAPHLSVDLDAWTRYVVRRQFDPQHGSPFWLKRATDLSFDPMEIERYTDLVHFGPFSLDVLREQDPVELVPLAVPRPVAGKVWDTGGTTGDPCRVIYTEPMRRHTVDWCRWSVESSGFQPGRTWLQATPGGPHIIGNEAISLIEVSSARVYGIDMDPRWVKRLLREGRLQDVHEYTNHVAEQIVTVLRVQPVDYLSTTPVLFRVLVREFPELVSRLRGARLAGTQLTPAQYHEFTDALGGGPCSVVYGNTLGCSSGLPVRGDVMPYVPHHPRVNIAVVAEDDWTQTVDYGQRGQVRLTVLHDDLFLPNVLERDEAMRYDLGDEWPCDGVANVGLLRRNQSLPEGIY